MTVGELIRTKALKDVNIYKGDLIGIDDYDGKKLFDTRRNKEEYLEKYLTGEIISLWMDTVCSTGFGYGVRVTPILKCYVKHDSWLKECEETE